jgi:SAM-dependent MidA family methyltransferase
LNALAESLAREIAAHGPMPVAHYMARALGDPQNGYYITRDPLGAAGDFTTAPEISQIFGELIGLWCADLWQRAGQPAMRLVELGPGRGTLMADLLRAARQVSGFEAAISVHLVETSPVLRAVQAKLLPDAIWHDALEQVPDDLPMLLVANEFFDALPIRQFIHTEAGWRERHVGHDGCRFLPVAGKRPVDTLIAPVLIHAPLGSVVESAPASGAIAAEIGARLNVNGGAALIIDYGYNGPVVGDTLQALKNHQFADVYATPGEADLTAHVDFTALAAAAQAVAHGPVKQGLWLQRLGIDVRAHVLAAGSTPATAAAIHAGSARLTGPMGSLFKALALTGADWPTPAGFA